MEQKTTVRLDCSTKQLWHGLIASQELYEIRLSLPLPFGIVTVTGYDILSSMPAELR